MDSSSLSDSLKSAPESRSGAELFADGFLDAVKRPLKGAAQLSSATTWSYSTETSSNSLFHTAGEMAGNATLFYAAATVLRNIPRCAQLAPIAAGGVLGFLEPAKDNRLGERVANAARGATTMAIMEKVPGFLAQKGFRGDLVGSTLNVAYTGAIAGAVDCNLNSLLTENKVMGLQNTAAAAVSWGVVASAFHLGSLPLSKGFQAVSENQRTELLLFSNRNGEHDYTTREFLNSLSPYGISYRQVDVSTPGLSSLFDAKKSTVVFPDLSRVEGSDRAALAKKLNLHTTSDYDNYRIVVVGAGPGGVQAAMNAASELPDTQRVAVIADVLGGQARHTASVKNYMGFPDVSGADLMARGIKGARDRGAEFIINRVSQIEPTADGRKLITLADGSKTKADAVVLATGMSYNQLQATGMERLTNKGVYTLADAQEAAQSKGKTVFVVGGGNSAGQAAINFDMHGTKEVHLIARTNLSYMSQYLIDEVKQHPNIKVHLNSEVAAVDGTSGLERVTLKSKNGDKVETQEMPADAMYVYIGGKPNTGFLSHSGIELDSKGFIKSGAQLTDTSAFASLRRPPLPFETSMPGVFASGDVSAASDEKRIAIAVGQSGQLMQNMRRHLIRLSPAQSVRLTPAANTTPSRGFNFEIKLPTVAAGLMGGQLNEGPAVAH